MFASVKTRSGSAKVCKKPNDLTWLYCITAIAVFISICSLVIIPFNIIGSAQLRKYATDQNWEWHQQDVKVQVAEVNTKYGMRKVFRHIHDYDDYTTILYLYRTEKGYIATVKFTSNCVDGSVVNTNEMYSDGNNIELECNSGFLSFSVLYDDRPNNVYFNVLGFKIDEYTSNWDLDYLDRDYASRVPTK